MENYQCERCCKPCNTGITCDPCEIKVIKSFLENESWLKYRGSVFCSYEKKTHREIFESDLKMLELSIQP